MGMGATNTLERIAASWGVLDGAEIRFQASLDVPNGGVLFALPSLQACGLLEHTEKHFSLPKGYYRLASIFVLLAFMALCRLKSMEQLRYHSPGEWGKLIGLDRAPEVRTLRKKIEHLSTKGEVHCWSAELCNQWMEESSEDGGLLYVDGHVRVYNGQQTKLPRHYVSRQRLCQRATIDYWVNAMDGQPFFLVNKVIDPGLIKVLEQDIVPRLKKEVPHQPTQKELEKNPFLHRFTLIFDREGYSPGFFQRMKDEQIACITYNKFPNDDWPDNEFQEHSVVLVSGEVVKMELAERGTFIGGKLWMREVRKKTKSGSQTSILTTDYLTDFGTISAAMFARWSQENFFRYMREHYGLDRLMDYETEKVDETVKLVNPEYRDLDSQIRRKAAVVTRKQAQFGGMNLNEEMTSNKVKTFEQKKAVLHEELIDLQRELAQLKEKRKSIPKHITFGELPEDKKFKGLSTKSKHFIDTIKMIAYRAETAMAYVLRDWMNRDEDTRSLLRSIYSTEADILPDEETGTLRIRLHHLSTHSADETLRKLCNFLNETETRFPGTNLRMLYELVSSQNPRDQES